MRLTRMREERKFKLIKYKAQVSSCSSVPYKIIVPNTYVIDYPEKSLDIQRGIGRGRGELYSSIYWRGIISPNSFGFSR